MDSLQTLEEMEQEQSQVGQAESHTNMQLLSVPGSASPGGGSTGGLGTCNVRDSKFMRRYSCNPQGKGTPHPGHLEPTPSSSSPSMMRRSSLAGTYVSVSAIIRFTRFQTNKIFERDLSANTTKVETCLFFNTAIKWSVLARRISMGLAHDREPPEDPTKVQKNVYYLHTSAELFVQITQPAKSCVWSRRERTSQFIMQNLYDFTCKIACPFLHHPLYVLGMGLTRLFPCCWVKQMQNGTYVLEHNSLDFG